jgi:HSP20 family protein
MILFPISNKSGEKNTFEKCESMAKNIELILDDTSGKWIQANVRDYLWKPAVDVCNKDNEIVVNVDIPGFKKNELSVSVEKNVLLIKGRKEKLAKTKRMNVIHEERCMGSFFRGIPLFTGIDRRKSRASYKNGVLHVDLPKRIHETTEHVNIAVQ